MSSKKEYELSNPQKRIWLTELLNDRKDMSNIGYLIELKGEYDLEQLAQAVKHVVKANTGLHLRFRYTGDDNTGDLVQYMPEYEEVAVDIVETASEEELYDIIEAKHRRQFDITGKFFCSFVVFSIAGNRFGLFEKANHLVADGISAVVVARETIDTYKKMAAGEFTGIEKEYTYIDFLESEQEYIAGEKYAKDKAFWLETFRDYRGEEITFQSNKDKINSLKVNRKSFRVPEDMIPTAEEYKTNNRLSNFPLFMAALSIYFNRFLNHDDMVIGMPVHNRSKKIFRDMVGMFVSTIPLRITFDDTWTFNECTAYIKKQLWESLKHQGYPFNHLTKDLLDLKIDAGTLLNVQLIELPGGNEAEIEKRAFYSTRYNISQLSIYLNQQNSPALDELDVAVDYHEDIFTEREVASLFHRLTVILEQCIAEPGKKISELPLLEEAEYKELVYDLNDTGADFPEDKTLHRLFEEQAAKNPGNIAIECEGETVTYGELNDLSTKAAAKLQQAGVTAGAVVGMLCERSIDALIAIMGILKAGGAYVPIDPAYPPDRRNYIIENSGLKVLLVEKDSAGQESEPAARGDVEAIKIDYAALKDEKIDREFAPPALTGDNLAYVIYTSGTTGKPKGTLLRHRNVVNYITWGAGFYVKGEPTVFPLYTSLSFDLTVTSIFIPLLTGNKIVIYRESEDGLLIQRVIEENKVDIIKLTPSHLKIVKEGKGPVPRVRSFIVGGEELKTVTAREIDDYFGGSINIYNEYGPTETAVGCMIHAYDKEADTGLAVPIGKPSHNVNIYILDKNQRPLPLGIVGEIYIGGAGVALGYLKNEDLTAGKFVDNPFVPGEKMYRSGDLGRWNLDKTLEFFGRCDEQVKIRGYRIEPGEIEKQLLNIEGTKDAVVDVREDEKGQKSLCAYMVPVESINTEEEKAEWFNTANIRRKLRENLPDYMVPSFFVKLAEIPLTYNGKVDRRALPEPKIIHRKETGAMPAGEKESHISRIWSDVLGVGGIGMEDNFYELGGDSIKAVQIAARMNEMDLAVNARDVLNHQTIDRLISNVDFDREKVFYDQGSIEGTKALSPIESWFFENDFKNLHYFNQSVLLEFKEKIDQGVMADCFDILVKQQHDGLRINADFENKNLFYNDKHLKEDVEIEFIKIPADEAANPEAKIRETGERIKASFDIRESLLIKPAIFETASNRHYLLITAHHLVIDGVSWRILLEDLYNLYRGLSAGEEVTLPRKTASLIDWANGLREYAGRKELEQEVAVWEEAIRADFSVTNGELDEKEAGCIKDRGKLGFTLEQEQTEILGSGSRKTFKSDVDVLLVTALSIALYEYTGSEKVVVELENHGRLLDEVDVARTVGWFTAMYPKLIAVDKESLVDRIKSIKEQLVNTPDKHNPNKGIGYGVLKYLSQKISGEFKSRVRFNYLGQFDREVTNDIFAYSDINSGEEIDPENALTTQIEIDCMILNGRLIVDIYYSSILFNKEKIEELSDKIQAVLQQMITYFESVDKDEVHPTPSDYEADIDQEDLDMIIG